MKKRASGNKFLKSLLLICLISLILLRIIQKKVKDYSGKDLPKNMNWSTGMSAEFPRDFEWGVSSASYQIEGAVHEDGRGESIWDRFSHIPGNIRHDDTGDIAADFYHRYKEDIRIMKELGIPVFRFSLAWPRIFPSDEANSNEKGLAF